MVNHGQPNYLAFRGKISLSYHKVKFVLYKSLNREGYYMQHDCLQMCVCVCVCVTLCNAVTSITAMCVCVSLPCCHLFIPIESSIELYTHNTPVCLSCIHMTHLYFLVKALVVYFFGFGQHISLTVFTLAQTHTLCTPLVSYTCTSLFKTPCSALYLLSVIIMLLPSASDRCTPVFAAL